MIYIPMLANINLKLKYKDICKEIFSSNGYFDFTNLVPKDDFFTIEYKGQKLFEINLENIENVSNNVTLLKGATCLHIDKDEEGCLNPINITRVFNISDKYILVYLEFENVQNDCPINISILDNDSIIYSFLDVVPFSEYYTKNFHRTYAHGIEIDPKLIFQNMNKNVRKLTLNVSLLTGKEIYSQPLIINNFKSTLNPYTNLKPGTNIGKLDIRF